MSTATPTPDQPEGGPEVDWDALDAEVFGNEDTEAEAAAEADRQLKRYTAASKLAADLKLEGADRLSIAQAVSQAYSDIKLPGFESHYERFTTTTAPAETDANHAKAAVPEPAVLAAPVAAADEAAVRAGVAPLDAGMKFIVGLVAIAVAMLAAIGFVVSFDTQVSAVEPFFGDYAPLVPLGIDVGIVVFAALNLVLAKLNMSLLWLRAVPWALTSMSLYINLSAHDELVARIAHVALPGMWIIASEVGTHILRIRAGLEAGTRTESLGLARWLLSPVSTFRLWRHMRLWGVKTAGGAREVEAQRLKAKAALRFRYGIAWRAAAPIQLRTSYALRVLTEAEVYTWVEPETADDKPAKARKVPSPAKAKAAPAAASLRGANQPPTEKRKRATARTGDKATAPRVDDTEAITRLKALAPDESGHVSIKRARSELSLGYERAKRLLDAAGLLAPETATD
ncbi:DUF2637 domain-containing protein [Glycomyces paridis]|uniref:DUF2637 domain-containing protein n=1 Tax=Glycomyces paridis TaxID=2126555 RepID=A0A4V4HPE1_9ACTN|nr:DUF2637 domain-containing protein [Glycomyces paridis]THV29646.1 DUF2637 domain-containing protein [Glycomyces paridis]